MYVQEHSRAHTFSVIGITGAFYVLLINDMSCHLTKENMRTLQCSDLTRSLNLTQTKSLSSKQSLTIQYKPFFLYIDHVIFYLILSK